MKQATMLVPLVLLPSVIALPPNLRRRADPNDLYLDEAPTLDGPTSDKSAGIRVEFELSVVVFMKNRCSAADTNQAKGQQVGGWKEDNWQLTADTTEEAAGMLTAEYILNSKTIKIGTSAASVAAAAVSSDILAWNPYLKMPNNQWNIKGNKCNPWEITSPTIGNSAGNLLWSTQVTTPLPFEAINDLFAAALVPPVKSTLPGTGILYDLMKILACYKNDEDDVELDPLFCGGIVAAPKPNLYRDGIGWCLKNPDTNEQDCLTVEDWITSIGSGSSQTSSPNSTN